MSSSTNEEIVETAVHEARRQTRVWRRAALITFIALIASLLVVAVFGWKALDERDDAVDEGVAIAQKVREECAEKPVPRAVIDLCSNADDIVDDAPDRVIGKRSIPGPRGPSCIEELGYEECRGDRGPAGGPGRDGLDGNDGQDGRTGRPGRVGPEGPEGPPGAEGAIGPVGAIGPAGPAGPAGPEGPVGPAGPEGPTGPAGTSAYPFTFSFVVEENPIQSTRYTVTCTEGGCDVTRESVEN